MIMQPSSNDLFNKLGKIDQGPFSISVLGNWLNQDPSGTVLRSLATSVFCLSLRQMMVLCIQVQVPLNTLTLMKYFSENLDVLNKLNNSAYQRPNYYPSRFQSNQLAVYSLLIHWHAMLSCHHAFVARGIRSKCDDRYFICLCMLISVSCIRYHLIFFVSGLLANAH